MLRLVVISIADSAPTSPLEAILNPSSGGTIGRSKGNSLILPDPGRQLLGVHAIIVFKNNRWLIKIRGQSVAFINQEKITRKNYHPISAGDVIRINQYAIKVLSTTHTISNTIPEKISPNPFDGLITSEGPTSEATSPNTAPNIEFFDLPPPPVASTISSRPTDLGLEKIIRKAILHQLDEIFSRSPAARESNHYYKVSLPYSPLKKNSDVRLGVAAPSECKRGLWFIAQFTAYPPNQEATVHSLLSTQNPNAQIVLGKRSCRWALGTAVIVKLQADHFEVENSSQLFIWNDCIESLDFRVRATDNAEESSILQFTAYIEGFIIATLCLNIRVGQTAAKSMMRSQINPARTAFASYSSADRPLVLQMVGAIERSAGIDVFLDCLDLMASEEWKPRLALEIANRDQFLLFWSNRSRRSQWVKWELNEALQKKSTTALQLHPIEPDIPLPNEIAHLHAGSIHALVANYYSKKPWWSRVWKIIRSSIK